jgi:hypothetical protein
VARKVRQEAGLRRPAQCAFTLAMSVRDTSHLTPQACKKALDSGIGWQGFVQHFQDTGLLVGVEFDGRVLHRI